MTRAELQAFFPPPARCVLNTGALEYAVPTLRWLQGPFWNFFLQRHFDTNTNKWKRRWQCRDFARAYATAAQECWANTYTDAPMDGLAVGEIWFVLDLAKPLEGHAVCPAITDHGLVFIEPQNNTLWRISKEQFESRYFLRF